MSMISSVVFLLYVPSLSFSKAVSGFNTAVSRCGGECITGENVCVSWWGSMVVWARVFSLPVVTSFVMLQGSLGYEQCCYWFVATGLISCVKGPSEYFGKLFVYVYIQCTQNLSALLRKIIPVCAVFLLCLDHSPIQLLPSWGLDSSQFFHNDKIKLALWVVHVKFLLVKAHCPEYFQAGFFSCKNSTSCVWKRKEKRCRWGNAVV